VPSVPRGVTLAQSIFHFKKSAGENFRFIPCKGSKVWKGAKEFLRSKNTSAKLIDFIRILRKSAESAGDKTSLHAC
jgi:hypothetical protein